MIVLTSVSRTNSSQATHNHSNMAPKHVRIIMQLVNHNKMQIFEEPAPCLAIYHELKVKILTFANVPRLAESKHEAYPTCYEHLLSGGRMWRIQNL